MIPGVLRSCCQQALHFRRSRFPSEKLRRFETEAGIESWSATRSCQEQLDVAEMEGFSVHERGFRRESLNAIRDITLQACVLRRRLEEGFLGHVTRCFDLTSTHYAATGRVSRASSNGIAFKAVHHGERVSGAGR